MAAEKMFPSIKTLFADSWQAMTKSLLNVFILSLISFGMGLVIMLAGVIATVGFGALAAVTQEGKNWETFLANPKIIASLGIGGLIFFLSCIFAMTVFSIASVYAVANWQKKPRLGECLGQGFKLFFPLLAVSILIGFISFGGWWLFMIPGILMMLFFMFSRMEVILAGKRFLEALKGSIRIVSQNFGEVFGRMLLFTVGGFILSYIIGRTLPFLSLFCNLFFSWFATAYIVVLYQQAKAATDEKQEAKLGWIWITSILGWLIFALFCVGMVKLAKTPAMQEKITAAKQQFWAGNSSQEIKEAESHIQAANLFLSEANELAKKTPILESDKQAITALIKKAIKESQAATEVAPKYADSWVSLGHTYRELSSFVTGAKEKSIEAYKKAVEINKNHIGALMAIGGIYQRDGNYPLAIYYLKQAQEIDPKYANAYYNLANTYKLMGDKDNALTNYKKTLELMKPDDPVRFSVEEEIKLLAK